MKVNLHPKVIPKDTPPAPLTKGGVVVGMKKEGDKEKIYFVGDDCHLLCVGATRSGKSRCLVLESICFLGLAGESIFCSDPKAELFHYTSEFLKKLGYEVLVLDFKTPAKSMRYNLLQPFSPRSCRHCSSSEQARSRSISVPENREDSKARIRATA